MKFARENVLFVGSSFLPYNWGTQDSNNNNNNGNNDNNNPYKFTFLKVFCMTVQSYRYTSPVKRKFKEVETAGRGVTPACNLIIWKAKAKELLSV